MMLDYYKIFESNILTRVFFVMLIKHKMAKIRQMKTTDSKNTISELFVGTTCFK